MSKNIKNVLTGIGFVASALTLQSWLQNFKEVNTPAAIAAKQDLMNSTLKTIAEEVGKSSELSVKSALVSKTENCSMKFNELIRFKNKSVDMHEKLKQVESTGDSELIKKVTEDLHKNDGFVNSEATNFENCFNDLREYIANLKPKYIGDNINILIEQFKAYLDTLNIYQLCILFDLLASLLILIFIINIIFAFYGNKLIDYFNLESKFPKLSKIIKLRRNLSEFSILLNLIIIIIMLGLTIYVNIVTLLV